MSTVATERDIGQSIVLYDISWEQYERILEIFSDRRFRHTYDQGTLEIMSPTPKHERVKRILDRLIEGMAEECEMNFASFGSMTQWRRKKKRGLESDECYYIAREPLIRHREDLDFNIDPPPDLAVEVDVSRSAIGRLPVYASLGIPEVWRYDDDDRLTFFKLVKGGRYVEIEYSIAFSFLASAEMQRFLDVRLEVTEFELKRKFVRWVRKKIK
jgi:Uma2 family endonuclease